MDSGISDQDDEPSDCVAAVEGNGSREIKGGSIIIFHSAVIEYKRKKKEYISQYSNNYCGCANI